MFGLPGVMALVLPPFLPRRRTIRTWPLLLIGIATVLLIPLAAVFAQERGAAPFTVAESGRGYDTLQDAVDAIGAGTGTILIAPGTYRQCAVQHDGVVTFRARVPGEAVLAGTACEGKAALVLRGEGARVEGLVFTGIAVPDRNGAGIRLENGNLAVSQSWFRDSEQGIISVNGKAFRVTIDKATFTRLGTCEGSGGCAHGIYMGDYGELSVTRSRFEAGRGGHYLKSRAARTSVTDSSFDDSAGRDTNYMIDLPNGGTGEIRGNWFVQGRDKDNWSTFIAVGAEGARYSADGLVIADNEARLVPGLIRTPAFVADWTGDRLAIADNRLATGIVPFVSR